MRWRKTLIIQEVTEETLEADETGAACAPIKRGLALAILRAPFAGRFGEDLAPLV